MEWVARGAGRAETAHARDRGVDRAPDAREVARHRELPRAGAARAIGLREGGARAVPKVPLAGDVQAVVEIDRAVRPLDLAFPNRPRDRPHGRSGDDHGASGRCEGPGPRCSGPAAARLHEPDPATKSARAIPVLSVVFENLESMESRREV